jgi:hypothetical protein
MTKEEFITERTRIISEMLDNPDEYGIYPTTKCFKQLDELFDKLQPQEYCTFYSDQSTTSATKCKWCGKEKYLHY